MCHCLTAGRSLTIDDVEDMLEHGNVAVFTEGIVMETKHERDRLADIEARHSDIIKLETSIKELHDLFVDMNTLVDFQVFFFIYIIYIPRILINFNSNRVK